LGGKEKEVLPSKFVEEAPSSKGDRTNKLNALAIAIAIAESLPSGTEYYAHQFELLNSSVTLNFYLH
jgi:hypothetical protein